MTREALDQSRLRQLIEAGRSLVAELDPDEIVARALEFACGVTGARRAAIAILAAEDSDPESFIARGVDEGSGDVRSLFRGGGAMALPIAIRGEHWGDLYLAGKEGGQGFDAADEEAATILAEWTAIAVGNARAYHDTERQRDELRQAVESLEAMTEVARAAGGETDLQKILENLVERGRELVGARSLLVLLEEEGELRVAASAGEHEGSDLRVKIEGAAPGQELGTSRPRRFSRVGRDLLSPGAAEADESALAVPLTYRGHQLGALVALDPLAAGDFSPSQERVLSAFAASAATAVATAQSAAEQGARRSVAAAERERGRWARELHDESLQNLAGLRVVLAAIRGRSDDDRIAGMLDQALGRLDETIAEMRRLIEDLRPASLDQLGVEPALSALVERIAGSESLDVSFRCELAHEQGSEEARLAKETEEAIYRVVQEALNNIAQHAEAQQVTVTVLEANDAVELCVEDDGCGFDASQPSSGFGLRGMRERLALVGGKLEIESSPGDGTRLLAQLPARREERAQGGASAPQPASAEAAESR